MLEEIMAGARYARSTPAIALVLGVILAMSLFVINFNTLVPLFARDVLHEGAHGFGLLMGALGMGAVIGALALTFAGPRGPSVQLVIGGAVVAAGAVLALSAVRQFWLASVALLVIGCAQIVFTTSANSTLQMTAPDQLRGRVMSLYAFVFVGSSPFGSLLVGSVAEKSGVPAACALGGGAGLLLVLLQAVNWRHRRRRGSLGAAGSS